MAKSLFDKSYYRSSAGSKLGKPLSPRLAGNKPDIMDRGGFVLGFLAFFLLVVASLRIIGGTEIPTFRSFLDVLTNAPTISMPFGFFSQLSLGDWGFFNWLKDFLSMLLSSLDVLMFLVGGMINIIIYLVYFIRWMFVM